MDRKSKTQPKTRGPGRPARHPRPSTATNRAPLPDFDLAPLSGFNPAALPADTEVGRFILVLAAVFNDLKDAIYAVVQLEKAQKQAVLRSPSWGQLIGMKNHALRDMVGVLRELMVAISEQKDVVEGSLATIVSGLGQSSKGAWSRLRAIAFDEDYTSDPISLVLVQIRGGLSFHYSRKLLAKAYTTFFSATPTADDGSIRDRALVSDGDHLEGTRFYFVEAAISQGLISFGLAQTELASRLTDVAKDVNEALKHIVIAYIRSVTTLAPYKPS